MSHIINPETAAHNIATAFCEHEIQKLNATAFIPGEQRSNAAAKEIWQLYANIYDVVFDAASEENKLSMEEE